jgi:hypothetical protein
MPAANVSYFENLWYRQKGNRQAVKDFSDRNRLHGHDYVPGRP